MVDSRLPLSEPFHLTAQIVAAYVEGNAISPDELPGLIQSVRNALRGVGPTPAPKAAIAPEPAVPIKRSLHRDYLVCLEDGVHVTMLKRYLWTRYQLTPEAYRAKWGLPHDYPMVAPVYAERRSTLAKQFGLGRAMTPAKGPEEVIKAEEVVAAEEVEVEHTVESVFGGFGTPDGSAEQALPAGPVRTSKRKALSQQSIKSIRNGLPKPTRRPN